MTFAFQTGIILYRDNVTHHKRNSDMMKDVSLDVAALVLLVILGHIVFGYRCYGI